MKLRRRLAYLLIGPVAAAGCTISPLASHRLDEPVVSLERPEPPQAMQRSAAVESDDADIGALRAAKWFQRSDNPEEQRQILLTGARRRASQQMSQQMMMTMPLLMQEMQAQSGPVHPGGGQGSPSAPQRTTSGQTTPTLAMPQMMLPQLNLTPEAMAEAAEPRRRGFRGLRGREEAKESRAEAKVSREETAATTEADRIERAAQAEAERAEKAAIAEATIAERRLLAEAELAERMTRAELELAERLASAKEERDRRIALTREERELRMAILGIDAAELDSDPVDEALAKINGGTKPRDTADGASRLSKIFRPRAGGSDTAIADTRKSSGRSPTAASSQDAGAREDLVARSLEHSEELLDRPSIAEYASSRPAEFPSVVKKDGRQPDNAKTAPETDRYDELLSRDAVVQTDPAEPEDWSLLNDFLASTAEAAPETSTSSAAPEFPLFAANGVSADSTATAEAATSPPAFEDSSTIAASDSFAPGANRQKSPDDDLWILGAAGGATTPPDDVSDRAFPESTTPAQPETFTQPGGLFARASEPAAEAAADIPVTTAIAATESGSPPAFPDVPTSDPWVDQPAPAVAAADPAAPPQFDWSHSAPESVDQVVHQPLPSPAAPIQNAAWTHQSLRDICGPLPQDLEALVNQLDIPEAGVRKAVLQDLAQLGAKARPAVPAVRILLDDSPLVAAHAAWTLWQIEANEEQSVRDLVRLLQSGDPETVQFTAYALGSMGPKALSAAPTLRAERERFNGATRVHVAEALSKIDAFDQASVEVLMYGLQHPDTHVRWLSALALGEVQPRYADIVVPSLVDALKDADSEVRSASALSIGGFGRAAESAVPELQSRATLDAPSVQEAAQTALACIQR